MTEKRKLSRDELILSPVAEDDALEIAEGTYAALHVLMNATEPEELRPAHEQRVARFAKRFKPAFSMPHTKWTKACLKSNPDVIIGHSGWTTPEFGRIFNPWRKDAATELGWAEQEGWSQAEIDDMWAGTDEEKWQNIFVGFDKVREEMFGNEGQWLLAPLWVLPEYQGRGVGGILLREVFEIADAQDPPSPICLEAMKAGRPIYEHLDFVVAREKPYVMVRRGPRTK